jgi:hypothetical protein
MNKFLEMWLAGQGNKQSALTPSKLVGGDFNEETGYFHDADGTPIGPDDPRYKRLLNSTYANTKQGEDVQYRSPELYETKKHTLLGDMFHPDNYTMADKANADWNNAPALAMDTANNKYNADLSVEQKNFDAADPSLQQRILSAARAHAAGVRMNPADIGSYEQNLAKLNGGGFESAGQTEAIENSGNLRSAQIFSQGGGFDNQGNARLLGSQAQLQKNQGAVDEETQRASGDYYNNIGKNDANKALIARTESDVPASNINAVRNVAQNNFTYEKWRSQHPLGMDGKTILSVDGAADTADLLSNPYADGMNPVNPSLVLVDGMPLMHHSYFGPKSDAPPPPPQAPHPARQLVAPVDSDYDEGILPVVGNAINSAYHTDANAVKNLLHGSWPLAVADPSDPIIRTVQRIVGSKNMDYLSRAGNKPPTKKDIQRYRELIGLSK